MSNKSGVIIFGGSGFIGTHTARYLLDNNFTEKVYCVDIKKPRYISDRIEYIEHDLRSPFNRAFSDIATVYNFAAVHTTPGHADREYFETNINGAKNVCAFAEKNRINTIVFTSSISPYGSSEALKDENSLTQPKSAYGSSKLAAEYIHKCWLEGSPKRKLAIVRPGVVFGHGEGGNLTRLYKALKGGYFFYPGRKDTKKACIYIKDLVCALYQMSMSDERYQLYNMCYPESPSIQAIVNAIAGATGVRKNCPVVPGPILRASAGTISFAFKLTGIKGGIHPERVEKLMISTNISGKKLKKSPYAVRFFLEEAIRDWYNDCEKKGLF